MHRNHQSHSYLSTLSLLYMYTICSTFNVERPKLYGYNERRCHNQREFTRKSGTITAVKHIYDDTDGETMQLCLQTWFCGQSTSAGMSRLNIIHTSVRQFRIMRQAGGKLTLDRVRFLGTAVTSICRSAGSGMPKAKPPYLKNTNMHRSKTKSSECRLVFFACVTLF